ncbi:replication restart DNA helicase PriA [Frondihabitans sp. PhB188]|uniref:primosomal protein N' family DNA-binding protein n=1 Tax=Frondihabitans sp. PhB188 TaxID=2485200 RepID=UPI000F481545|nr:primosomal protein N' [Frondihabitans sp. PhB188]ROQ41027.1 replication restart DNA helicase PriA [Frondihabitans sp. PhB188]
MPRAVARVLVDTPLPQLDRLFDYAIPERLRGTVGPGMRVKVPLRSAGRMADAFVIEVAASSEHEGSLSEVDELISEVPVLAPEVWRLARALADRAGGSASDVLRLAVPTRQVRVEKAWLAARAAKADAAARPEAADGDPEADGGPETGSGARAQDQAGSPVPAPPLLVAGYRSADLAAAVRARARLALDAVPLVVELPASGDAAPRWVGRWAVTLAELATVALADGDSAILAVPDYRDQEQLIAALEAVVPPERIVRLDARQSNPDRYRGLLRARGDEALVLVGNRSVLLAPAAHLGLIAVWDDGDPLFSEPLSPYAHARDTALLRYEQQGPALVFAGHARSTDVQRLVEIGWLTEALPDPRYQPRVIPTTQQGSREGFAANARIPSTAWTEAKAAVEFGPVLVQVAHPGYAPRLACTECGDTARCLRCSGPLQQKAAGATPACAWCGALAVGWHCTTCENTKMRTVGTGAGRTADELGRAFPGVRVIVSDGTRQVLEIDDEPAIVVATRGAEPIAPGGYRAVLLLDGERMLARESLRVAEDCLRWWADATALARHRAPIFLVGVGGALASALSTWNLARFASSELADRRELRFPPAVRVATVTGQTVTVEEALDDLPEPIRAETLGPVDVEGGTVRAIVRFDYAAGHDVASILRGRVIRAATSRRKLVPGDPKAATRRSVAPTLRVRFDDVEPFAEQ